jgi:hypothetical protein
VIPLDDAGPLPLTICNTSAPGLTASSSDDQGDWCDISLLPIDAGQWTGAGNCLEQGQLEGIQSFTMWMDAGKLDYSEFGSNGQVQVNGSCIKD